jgi:thiamine-monophosphate kinase
MPLPSRRSRTPLHSRSGPARPPARPGGELALIQQIRRRAATATPPSRSLILGIGDDCAILRPRPGEDLVVTTDFSLETRHFRRDWHPARAVGHRTLARGLSDLAAMGARPLAAFLSLALPRSVAASGTWLAEFLDGLLALATTTGTPLAGGDTSESPTEHILADIVLLGAVPAGRALRRDRAQPGDRLFVTGALGGAAAELTLLPKREKNAGKLLKSTQKCNKNEGNPHPHLYPEPRLAVGQALLRRHLATAALDLSDGLSTDLTHLCEASGLRAEIYAAQIPVHPLASQTADPLALALHGGEDYELLFTAPSTARVPRSLAGIPLTEIGRLIPPGRGARGRITLIDLHGRRSLLKPGGWEHLR